MRLSAGFIDTFSTAIDDLPRADQANQLKVLAVLAQTGRFSCFEASANQTIARTMTALMRGPLVESYVPDSYKSKAESGGVSIQPIANCLTERSPKIAGFGVGTAFGRIEGAVNARDPRQCSPKR